MYANPRSRSTVSSEFPSALGIGANTAIFSVVHAVLAAYLPCGDPYEVSAHDPATFATVSALIAGVAIAASVVPAFAPRASIHSWRCERTDVSSAPRR